MGLNSVRFLGKIQPTVALLCSEMALVYVGSYWRAHSRQVAEQANLIIFAIVSFELLSVFDVEGGVGTASVGTAGGTSGAGAKRFGSTQDVSAV
jgi:hypothetical protein